jgi:hypothetical protein
VLANVGCDVLRPLLRPGVVQGRKGGQKRLAVGEEAFVPVAQVVQTEFAPWCMDKPILGATTMAHGQYVAGLAVGSQAVLLGPAKLPLGRAFQKRT